MAANRSPMMKLKNGRVVNKIKTPSGVFIFCLIDTKVDFDKQISKSP